METYTQRLKNNDPIDEDLLRLIQLLEREMQLNSLTIPQGSKVLNNGLNKLNVSSNCSLRNGTNLKSNSAPQSNNSTYINPELSGKLLVLYRLMGMMRAVKQGERIVIVSNYTSTLDLIEKMCK